MTETMVLDAARIDDMTDRDRQLENELASLYVSTAQRYVEQMAQCLEQGVEWSAPAHALKGASANLGAPRMRDLALAAETSAPTPDLLRSLESGLEDVRRALVGRTGELRLD